MVPSPLASALRTRHLGEQVPSSGLFIRTCTAPIDAQRHVTDIFISYAREDQRVADALAKCLAATGWSVFVDHDAIPMGMAFDDFIERELTAAKHVLVLWSSASIKSKWVLAEAHEALSRNSLLPVLLETGINIPFAFRRFQAKPLIDWDGSGEAPAFRQLSADIAFYLGQPASLIDAPSTAEPDVPSTDSVTQPPHRPQPDERAESRPVSNVAARAARKLTHADIDDISGLAWIHVTGGTFAMGAADIRDAPAHRVTLSPYKISRFPITNAQFLVFVQDAYANAPRNWDGDQIPVGKEDHPVVCVSWPVADSYCAWLTERIQSTSGGRVQLPTEAQWEFAARGTQGRSYPWGDEAPAAAHANFNSDVGDTTAVGSYPDGATPRGIYAGAGPGRIYDLAGNVWEWCRDWYAPYDLASANNPAGPGSGWSRALRGGSFLDAARDLRAACRRDSSPTSMGVDIGFRVTWSEWRTR